MRQITKTIHASSDGTRRCVQTFNHGVRRVTFEYRGESWTSYLIIPRESLLEGIRRSRARGAQFHDCEWWTLIPGLDRWVRPGGTGGPGETFSGEPVRLNSSRRYMVIAQSGGLDI